MDDFVTRLCSFISSEAYLLSAVLKDCYDDVERLVKAGISVNITNDENNTLLHIAVKNNNLKILQLLLSQENITVNDKNSFGWTPLFLAVINGSYDAAALLIKAGANVNIPCKVNRDSPLHITVKNDNLQILDLLLSQEHIHINSRNLCCQTPLFLAAKDERYEATKRLLEAGAEVNLVDNEKLTPLHVAVYYPKVAHCLILHGANIDATDSKGETPLHKAVYLQSCLETVCMLLYYNADADKLCKHGSTPFINSLIFRHVPVQSILFDYVTDFDRGYHNETLLELAIRNDSPLIKEIIEKNVDISTNTLNIFLRLGPQNEHIFKSIWDRLQYSNNYPILTHMFINFTRRSTPRDVIEKFLNIIIESPNTNLLVNNSNSFKLQFFLTHFYEYQCDMAILNKLICQLLQYSYKITVDEICKIFYYYGYCSLLKFLRYMEYEGSWKPRMTIITPRLIFDIHCNTKYIKKKFLVSFDPNLLELPHAKCDLENYFGYCADRQLMTKTNYNFPENVLPTVPKLVQLARDNAREYIVKAYNIHSTCQYYTKIDELNIPQVCKNILKFEIKLYQIKL